MQIIKDEKNISKELIRIADRINLENNEKINTTVKKILKDVKNDGDEALRRYTKKFDGFNPGTLLVSSQEIEEAWKSISKSLKDALKNAKNRIEEFHLKEIPQSFSIKGIYGEIVQRKWLPVQKAGLYIPGGRASYPSTVLMNVIPAQVAGVNEIIMVSPANKEGNLNKTVLAAAHICGIKKIFKIGGAQAIAAMAFGTQSISKVDVITGPGNIFVTTAKKLIFGSTGIDSLAGPSEILIIADSNANSKFLANDLLAQAEHDPYASAILLTTSSILAKEVVAQIYKQLENHPRKEICMRSIKEWGLIGVCENIEKCIEFSNQFAPEHLEIMTNNPKNILDKIENAGAIFLGQWTPEAVGDYIAGPNHTLPTSGNAKFSGALGVETFMKNSSIIEFNEQSLEKNKEDIINLAMSEGLHSHANSVEIRFDH